MKTEQMIDNIYDKITVDFGLNISGLLIELSFISAKIYLTQYEANYKTKIETEEGDKFYRILTDEDNIECILDDQSEETIKAIREIVCK